MRWRKIKYNLKRDTIPTTRMKEIFTRFYSLNEIHEILLHEKPTLSSFELSLLIDPVQQLYLSINSPRWRYHVKEWVEKV